jgi:hypothetical protein
MRIFKGKFLHKQATLNTETPLRLQDGKCSYVISKRRYLQNLNAMHKPFTNTLLKSKNPKNTSMRNIRL